MAQSLGPGSGCTGWGWRKSQVTDAGCPLAMLSWRQRWPRFVLKDFPFLSQTPRLAQRRCGLFWIYLLFGELILNAIECALTRKDNKQTDLIFENLSHTAANKLRPHWMWGAGNDCLNLTGTDLSPRMPEPSNVSPLETFRVSDLLSQSCETSQVIASQSEDFGENEIV